MLVTIQEKLPQKQLGIHGSKETHYTYIQNIQIQWHAQCTISKLLIATPGANLSHGGSTFIQMTVNMPGKAAVNGPSTRAPATHTGDTDEAPGSGFAPDVTI